MLIHDTRAAFFNCFLFAMVPVLVLGVAADQASKSWASLQAVEPRILVTGYVAAFSIPNTGILLGVGNDQAQTSTVIALVGITYAGMVARFGYVYRGRLRRADWMAGTLLLAGIFGNTIDRLALGHVRDFIVIWAIPTVAFNVADLLVVAGVASFFISRCWDRRVSQPGLGSTACPVA